MALSLLLLAHPALGDAPASSPRPLARATVQAAPAPIAYTLRPRARPQDPNAVAVLAAPAPALRPRPRPAEPAAVRRAAPVPKEDAPKPGRRQKRQGGGLCGERDIEGETLTRIRSNVAGCGVAKPVRVAAVAGVRLNPPATMDCDTAIALKKWLKKGMRPAFGNREVVGLRIAAHYICRPRNNVRGNEVSEHGRGKAIDISGFMLADGREWSVVQDYNRQIRRAHKAACGIFGTTLGPGSDGFHEDHLHFDTADHRGGPYCR